MEAFIKRLSIVILFVVLFADCSKDVTYGLCKLQSDSFEQGTTTLTTYEYVEHRLVVQTTTAPGYSLKLNYKYNVDGLINEADAEKNGVTGRLTYDYDLKTQMARSTSVFGTDTVTTNYTYNDGGQLTHKIQVYVGALTSDTVTVDYTYPDISTHNPSSTVETNVSGQLITTFLQYDNKINPYREMFYSIKAYNNIVRIEADGVVTTISYAYNDLGYPVSATWSTGETQTFTYMCE